MSGRNTFAGRMGQTSPGAEGWHSAFDFLPAGLFLLTREGRIHRMNPAGASIVGAVGDTLIDKPLSDLVFSEDRDLVLETLADVQINSVQSAHRDFRLINSHQHEPQWVGADFSLAHKTGSAILMQFQQIDTLMRSLTNLRKSETRWRTALESSLQGVWDHDFQSNELFYSATWRRMRGLPPDAKVDGTLEVWIQTVHPDDRAHVLDCIRRQEDGVAAFNTFQYRERRTDGKWIWIESRGAAVEWGADGKPTRIIGTDTDITDRKNAEMQLEQISRRLRLALDVSKIGVFEANLDTGAIERDPQLMRIYGLEPSSDEKNAFEKYLHPEDRAKALNAVRTGIASKAPFANDFRIIRPDGEVRFIRSSSMTFTDSEGAHKLIGGNWDATDDIAQQADLERAWQLAEARNAELEAARSSIEYNALHDHLTALPNRRYLDRKLDAATDGRPGFSAILHLDLDRFKQINDTLGHQAGDAMLIHTAGVLTSLVSEKDFIARIGGDEFMVLCATGRTEDEVTDLANRIIETLRQPVSHDGHECRFGASIGIAWTGECPTDARQSLMNADLALYRAKSLGRNRFEFFSRQLQTQIHHAKRTADEIIQGIEQNAFFPVYQPQFDARTLDIVGVETLARWRHPQRGIVAPDYFLDIARDIDILSTIDRLIAEQALRDLRGWDADAIEIGRLSVNVSSRRLREPGLLDALKELKIPKDRISFELLESIFLDDLEEPVTQTIAGLKTLGIEIEIDDFGTGHASIIGLLKLSPARLKIDRAIIVPMTDGNEHRRLVGSIIDIGHSLNIKVIAEGVETMAHASILRDLGCDALQGYAFAKPMTEADLRTFVAKNAWRGG